MFQTCKDTKFVSNSQLRHLSRNLRTDCFRRAKIQNLSAIHNLLRVHCSFSQIVSDVQRYKICQQFTTISDSQLKAIELFQTCKDTKFVSNSQHYRITVPPSVYCFRRAKIQNLSAIHNLGWYKCCNCPIVSDVQRYKICQQFTTRLSKFGRVFLLFQTCKDTKFVSNSQHINSVQNYISDCFRRAKIQNLSAIHNKFDNQII